MTENPQNPPVAEADIAAWVGLDWADQHHLISLQAADGHPVETGKLEHSPEALQAWVGQLQVRFGGRKIAIALEQSRGAVLYALMVHENLLLYPVPPQSLARYREAFYPSGAKGDPSDADWLRELLQKHHDRLRVWVPDDPRTRRLQLLVEYRRQQVDTRTRLTNQLTSLLKCYFPQALDWAGSLDTVQACDFLQRWPTLEAVQKTTPGRLRKFYNKHHCRRRIEPRLKEIPPAQPLTTDAAILQSHSLMVQALAGSLRASIRAIAQLEQHVTQAYEQHPDHRLFDSFPGAGAALGPRLLAAFGADRHRFHRASEMQQLSGIAPVTKASGKFRVVQRRLACPKFLRQTFHEFAGHSIRWCQWARAVYLQQRSRGKGHHAAVRVVAYKWIRVLFRCWKDRLPYNEQIYLTSLERRNPTLLCSIQPAAPKPQASPKKLAEKNTLPKEGWKKLTDVLEEGGPLWKSCEQIVHLSQKST
jgi:transposase